MSHIDIVGGCYRESCLEPTKEEFFGSGGRGAAIISQLPETEVQLHTCGSRSRVEELAGEYGFDASVTDAPEVSFEYVHPYSTPRITPPETRIEQGTMPAINGDTILRYGMMEASPIVHGKRVIYDPQSAFGPEHFQGNGSTAEELAIVANVYEGSQLTGAHHIDEIGRQLLADSAAVAVVLKNGIQGLRVFQSGEEPVHLPAHATRTSYKIGSGDVFSSTFAYYWGQENRSPLDAAREASRAVAIYVSGLEPSQFRGDINTLLLTPVVTPSRDQFIYDVYLAGPFFSLAENWLVHDAYEYLQGAGLRVFSPLHDVGRGEAMQVAPKDLSGLRASRFVFACLDDLDPGTLFEVGYARALDKPVLFYATKHAPEDLKMLIGSGCMKFNDVGSVYAACVAYGSDYAEAAPIFRGN